MTDRTPRNIRPVLAADVERLAAGAAHGEPFAQLELAHATAAAVVAAGRGTAGPGTAGPGTAQPSEAMLHLAETVGLDTLAELWRGAAADTLPGALWTLYLLRTWCVTNGDEVARLYRAGRGLAPVDEVVAGVHDDADPDAVLALADAVLRGLYGGDLAVALERGAAFFRVVAAGRAHLADEGPRGTDELRRAARNRSCAESLNRAARGWRAGTLR